MSQDGGTSRYKSTTGHRSPAKALPISAPPIRPAPSGRRPARYPLAHGAPVHIGKPDLHVVQREVDPAHELAAVTAAFQKRHDGAILLASTAIRIRTIGAGSASTPPSPGAARRRSSARRFRVATGSISLTGWHDPAMTAPADRGNGELSAGLRRDGRTGDPQGRAGPLHHPPLGPHASDRHSHACAVRPLGRRRAAVTPVRIFRTPKTVRRPRFNRVSGNADAGAAGGSVPERAAGRHPG